jgi:hypothetical protein
VIYNYYDSHYISNSDLKRLRKLIDPKFEDPADLEEIFSFGTLFHALVLEPHKADYNHKDFELANSMAKRFFDEHICRKIFIEVYDLRREHEYYRNDRFEVMARCKVDFESKMLGLCGELKGLSVSSEKAFDEAVDRFDYDQAIAWYMDVTGHQNYFLVAPSKIAEKVFKRFVSRDHLFYKRGKEKVVKAVKLFRETLMV